MIRDIYLSLGHYQAKSNFLLLQEDRIGGISNEDICKGFMRSRCVLPPSVLGHFSPFLLFLTLNLKALTNRKTFPTVNKHVNKSTRDAPDSRFIFKVPRRRGYLYRRLLFLLPLPLSLFPFISNAPFTYTSARPCTTLKKKRATIYVAQSRAILHTAKVYTYICTRNRTVFRF